jgi:hypothetical protein
VIGRLPLVGRCLAAGPSERPRAHVEDDRVARRVESAPAPELEREQLDLQARLAGLQAQCLELDLVARLLERLARRAVRDLGLVERAVGRQRDLPTILDGDRSAAGSAGR